jgi:hypothetical protein
MLEDAEKEYKKDITKMITKDFFVENEIQNVKKIRNIENIRNYYYIFENVERVHIAEMYNDVYNMKQIKKIKEDDSVLFKFKNRKLIYFENYLKTLPTARKYIFTLIEFYKHTLNGIQILSNNHIINNHINSQTILVDDFETPLLCNFKFSIDVSRPDIHSYIKHFFISYNTEYLAWAPELHLLSYLLTNKLESLSMYNIEHIIHDCISNNILLHNFGDNVVNQFKQTGIDYFKKYVNKSYDFIISDILQHYHTWDNYALSITYLQMLVSIHKKIQKNNKFIIIFIKLLL